MKLNKFTVVLALLLISIMAIGAVSAESVGDSDIVAVNDDIGDIQESVEVTDVADDLGTADTADETVEDAGGAVLGDEPQSYDLDDDTYSTYFNEDGTATEVINESSDYTLNIGTLNNKDIKILYGTNINIVGKEGAGIINNGTITIGDGAASAASITISGLTFTNTNKDGIAVNDLTTDVTIKDNKFDLTYDDSYMASPMAIVTYGYVNDVKIIDNNIKMVSAAAYTYGIDLSFYLPGFASHGMSNADEFLVANNVIDILSTASSGMAEGMYLDTIANSVIENNTLNIKSINAGVANYGMQVSDSWGWTDYTNPVNSAHNITIKNNDVVLESADMAYGITVIALCTMDMVTYDDMVFDMNIIGNNVTISSETGAVGIGAKSQDVKITDNKVTIDADVSKDVQCYADPAFGDESCAIYVNNYDDMNGPYANNTVILNNIAANVNPIKITKKDDNVDPLVISENTIVSSIFIIDDNDYDLYFNEDGTPKDYLSADGEYTLFIDTLNNKDITILTGQNIYIFDKEGAGFINNGTITIGNGIDKIESVQVSGLTFTNVNKDGIVVNQFSEFIGIAQNSIDLTYDSSYYNSPMAIVAYGYVNEVTIVGNNISMESEAGYTYGIDLTSCIDFTPTYGVKNAENFLIADNVISIVHTASYGMAEAMYLDSIVSSVIENNDITVVTNNAGVANYGMQVSDSSNYAGGSISSPYDVTIKDNNLVLQSADMVYGITVISLNPLEGSKNFVISGNDLNIVSATGAVGIGTASDDVLVADNTVTLAADPTKEVGLGYPDSYFGNISYGIFINNNDFFGALKNSTVTGNTITTNVVPIKVADEESEDVKPLVIEDNEEFTSYLINDDTYATYFNADGTIKDDAPISAGDVLLMGDLNGKKLVIDIPLTINAVPNTKLANTTINVTTGADGTVIDGLNMVNDITVKGAVIVIEEVNNVEITNCVITIPSATKMAYAIEIEAGTLGCNNISINNNVIDIHSSYNYVYGIDVYQKDTAENKHKGIYIFENTITVNSTGKIAAQGIYVTASEDVIIDGNIIQVISNGSAYGVATDRIADEVIANNKITLEAATMAYGVTATTEGTDVIIRANDINAKGTGAVGVGINNLTGATIEDNTIAIDGGDYTTITSADSLGTANAGILVGDGNTNVEMNNNDVTETSTVRLDTVIEVSDLTVTAAPSGEGKLEITLKTVSGMLLANQTVKVVFDSKMYEVTTDAKGVATFSFPLSKGGTYNVEIFYLGDDDYRGSDASAKITINKVKTSITASGKTFLATATTKKLTATLKDANGKAIAGKKVTFTVNGKTYTATTNAKGVATVKLALKAAKTYTVSIKFAGDGVYAASTKSVKVKLNKEKTKLTAPKKTFKRTAKTKKVVVTLKNSKGKAIAKKKVTLIVNKKKYTVKTNKKGKATFKVKLTKKGTFKYTVKFAGDTQYKAVKKSAKIKIK